MEILRSKKVNLPRVFYLTEKEQIKDIPIGIPFILGDENVKKQVVKMLEFEVLYENAIATGYPFNFKKILENQGYKNLEYFEYEHPVYFSANETTSINQEVLELEEYVKQKGEVSKLKKYIKDCSVKVDLQKLKDLNIFPVWTNDVEEAVGINFHNHSMYDYNLYNKKLGLCCGDFVRSQPKKNLINIDLSSSIPKGCSSVALSLSKNLAESFYADILVTGSITKLYEYEELHKLNVKTIYEEIGMANEQKYYKKLVTKSEREYGTCIVFGDNHTPSGDWGQGTITLEDGKKMCKWTVEKLICFHTSENNVIPGYATWFEPNEIEYIKNWVKYFV